jgi:predicted MPP superfamily phosphohydrolase
VRLRVRELVLPGLPPELDGLRIAHLSDFHLGVPSRGRRAVERAVEWVAERHPDLVAITGDLLSRLSGEGELLALLAKLRRADGSYRYSRAYATTPVWVTAQVLPALVKKPFPLR